MWNDLNMTQRNELIKLYLNNGISSLDMMKEHYNSFATGGHLYQDGGPDDDKTLVSSQASETGWMPEVEINIDRPSWQQGLTDYDWSRARQYYSNPDDTLTFQGFEFLKNVASKRRTGQSNFMRDVNKLSYIPNAAVGAIGAIPAVAGVIASLPSIIPYVSTALRKQLLKPVETFVGIGGGAGVDTTVKNFTDYSSWGDMIANKIFNNNNPLLKFGLELTNPGGYLGGAWGHTIDKKLAESIVRIGEPIKNLPNNVLFNMHEGDDLVKSIGKSVRNLNDEALEGSKKKIANYILNPLATNTKYDIPAFQYSGAKIVGAGKEVRPFRGDPVDVFFNQNYFNNYRKIQVPEKYISWAQKHKINPKRLRAYDLQEVDPDFISIGPKEVSSEGLYPIHRLQDKYRLGSNKVIYDKLGLPSRGDTPILDPGGFNLDFEENGRKYFSDIWKYDGTDGFNRYIIQEPSAKKLKPLVEYFGDFIDSKGHPFVTTFYTEPKPEVIWLKQK